MSATVVTIASQAEVDGRRIVAVTEIPSGVSDSDIDRLDAIFRAGHARLIRDHIRATS